MEEITDTRVVTVAEYSLSAEVFAIVLQFVLYVYELCIELVFPVAHCCVQIYIAWHVDGINALLSIGTSNKKRELLIADPGNPARRPVKSKKLT
jgi:hypothetical protein